MAISIVISKIVTFDIKGSFKTADGKDEKFDFSLTCDRLEQEQINAATKTEDKIVDFFVEHTKGWTRVEDEKKAPVPFSADALRQLFKIPGLQGVAWMSYLSESGVKAKN